jgi:hypothetical protein
MTGLNSINAQIRSRQETAGKCGWYEGSGKGFIAHASVPICTDAFRCLSSGQDCSAGSIAVMPVTSPHHNGVAGRN